MPLAEVRDRMDRLAAGVGERIGGAIPMGLPEVDRAIGGGLEAGAIHEFIGVGPGDGEGGTHAKPDRVWSPPLGVVAHVGAAVSREGWVVWIGESVWPYGRAMSDAVRARSVFVDARLPGDRVWSADVALRCEGVGCVVMDASRLAIAATRRLALGARGPAGEGRGIGLLVRPPWERDVVSVAHSRWTVDRRAPRAEGSDVGARDPGWILACVRCKGVQRDPSARWDWAVEWCCATGDVRVAPDVVDRSRAAEGGPRWGPARLAENFRADDRADADRRTA